MSDTPLKAPRKSRAKPKPDAAAEPVIVAYKGFDADWKCRGMQYAVGQTFTHDGPVEACSSGLHSCERPLDVLRYYRPGTSRFAVVKASGKISRHADDTKIASATLTVEAEIGLPEIIAKTIAWTLARCTPAEGSSSKAKNTVVAAKGSNESATASGYYGAATAIGNYGAATASGNYGAATASGYYGAATAIGNYGAATASGDYGAATASGDSGAATASGNYGAATASGYYGAATASGDYGAATASGNYGAATASGNYGAATASGNYGAATASGNYGAATAIGNYGAATASGNYGAATAIGNYGAATASGKKSAAFSPGRNGKARAPAGGAIFLTYRDSDWNIVHARASKVGENGIKPDVFYRLGADGEFVGGEMTARVIPASPVRQSRDAFRNDGRSKAAFLIDAPVTKSSQWRHAARYALQQGREVWQARGVQYVLLRSAKVLT